MREQRRPEGWCRTQSPSPACFSVPLELECFKVVNDEENLIAPVRFKDITLRFRNFAR